MWNLHKLYKIAVWSFVIFLGWTAFDLYKDEPKVMDENQKAEVLKTIEITKQ